MTVDHLASPLCIVTAALASQLHEGRAVLSSVLLSADGANGDCDLYDGQGVGGRLIAHIEALSGTSFMWAPPDRVSIEKGLHLVCNAITSIVTTTFYGIA